MEFYDTARERLDRYWRRALLLSKKCMLLVNLNV